MAIALDASTPARFSGTPADNADVSGGSGLITPPANSFLVACVEADSTGAPTLNMSVSDTGGLTWTKQVERNANETTTNGYSGIFTAPQVTSAARTVNVRRVNAGGGSNRISCVVYVFTGVDISGTPVDTVTASNEGGSATQNLTTTSITPGANGVLVAAGLDWNNTANTATSSDLKGVDSVAGSSHAGYAGAVDVLDGWKTCTSGVGVTANLNAGAASPQWKWCQIIVRESAGGGPAFMPRQNKPINQAVQRAANW